MKKSKIHTHIWIDSVNENCPFCGANMKLCKSPKCYLYMCKSPTCKMVVQIKRKEL